MILLTNRADTIYRQCSFCERATLHWIGVDGSSAIIVCGTCQHVTKRVELPAPPAAPAAAAPRV